jgi:TolB-like protein
MELQIYNEMRRRRMFSSALLYVPFAWVTTEALTFLFDKFSVPMWANDLAAAAFVAGFPAFMVLAWTFDVGQEGLTRTSATRTQGHMAILFAMLIMGAGTTVLFRQINSPPTSASSRAAETPGQAENSQTTKNSIAVYAFENLSSDPENAYFSEGMTGELIARLSQVKGLQIAAFTQSKSEVLMLGIEPKVSYRLEGSVRKAGNAVRIVAVLTDLSSGFTAWSEEFDGDLKDVFQLQAQTALRIVEALGMQLTPQETLVLNGRPTENLQAYDAYLRGWSLVESLHSSFDNAEEKLADARRHFQRALTFDAGYTRAIAGLSMVESYQAFFDVDAKSHQALARTLAVEALTSDESLYESHFAMARVLSNTEDTNGAIAEYRKVVELDPQNGYAWCEMSAVLNAADPVRAESAARNAIFFRPTYSRGYLTLGAALQKQERLGEAVDAYQQSLELDPSNRGLERVIGRLNSELAQQRLE